MSETVDRLEAARARREWSVRLLALLDAPARADQHDSAARLLRLFACAEHGAALERVLLDRTRDPWVRTYVLRALAERRLAVSGAAVDALLDEFLAALEPGEQGAARSRRAWSLARVESLASLASLCEASGARSDFEQWLGRLQSSTARAVVLANRSRAMPLRATQRQRLVRLCAARGQLDEALAWTSFELPECRALLLRAGAELDLRALERATRELEPDALEQAFDGYPDQLAAAARALALPLELLSRLHAPEQLCAMAWAELRRVNAQLSAGERGHPWRALRVLGGLPEAARELDAVLGDETFARVIHLGAARLRLREGGLPDADGLPEAAVLSVLDSEDASEALRPLLSWAARSDTLTLRYAGLRGLVGLGPARAREAFPDYPDAPLIELLRLGCEAALGDAQASAALIEAARSAPEVVERAQALRSLASARPRPPGYVELCIDALGDMQTHEMFYAPAASEAAICLARHPDLPTERVLARLVDAALVAANDDVWWAFESAIRSWLDGTPASIRPVWYGSYLAERAS